MLKMSKLTDYGTVVLAYMASRPGSMHSAAELADSTRLGLPTVSKVLKRLAGAGVLDSFRGAHGGYSLARDAESISAAEIIDALEGPIAITECSGDHSQCSLEAVCALGGRWQQINGLIRKALSEISLAELAGPRPLPEIRLQPALPADRQRLLAGKSNKRVNRHGQ